MTQQLTPEQMEKVANVQAVLVEDVRIPAFDRRCAELGIKFASEEDHTAAIETVAMLRIKEAQLKEQGVDTNPSPVKDVRNMLKQSMFGAEAPAIEKTASTSRLRTALEAVMAV
jgi:hypothetical protein